MNKSYSHICKSLVGAVVSLGFIGSAAALSDSNKTVDRFGVQKGGQLAYFNTLETSGVAGCQWGLVYIDITTEFGKAATAHLMAARASGKKLKWFEYSIGANNLCYLDSIEAER